MAPQQEDQDAIAQYLITELQMIQQRASQQEQAIATRTNLYIASLSIIAGGIFIAIDKQISNLVLMPIIILVLGFFATLGFITLAQTLDSYMSSVFLYRRMGRIRRYFVDKNPRIVKYMPFAFGDDRPIFHVRYAPLRGVEAILLLVNSLVVGLFIGLNIWLLTNYVNMTNLQWAAISLGLIVTYITWTLQVRYVRKVLESREEKEKSRGKILFPSDSKIYDAKELLQELLNDSKIKKD